MTDIVDGIENGEFRKGLLEDIGRSHQWDGYSGFENESEKKDNRDLDNEPSGACSGRYLKREIFLNAPIDDKKWDINENVPVRYRVTMFGNTPLESVVARVERNQEPDDAIPIEMIHANPDDPDLLYHISNFEVVRSNLSVENTLVRQAVDSNTMALKPPLKEIAGEVQGNDRKFGPDARFICDKQDSIEQMQVRDLSQITISLLEYIKEDSNTANSLDKNTVGESYGARTSAQEAGTIAANTQRPNLVNIEYILEQFLGFVARRYKVGWENYGHPSQVVQITNERGELAFVNTADISGEYDVVVSVMDDMKDDQAKTSRMINYAQVVATTPMVNTVDWTEFNKELSEKMMGTSKFVKEDAAMDAEALAKTNLLLMLNNGQMPSLSPNMNLRKHLEIYKSERMRWNGAE
jgi:hypothetical protein